MYMQYYTKTDCKATLYICGSSSSSLVRIGRESRLLGKSAVCFRFDTQLRLVPFHHAHDFANTLCGRISGEVTHSAHPPSPSRYIKIATREIQHSVTNESQLELYWYKYNERLFYSMIYAYMYIRACHVSRRELEVAPSL